MNKDSQFDNKSSDYYFSLLDVISVFKKRKNIFISVLIFIMLATLIYIVISPSVFKVGHKINIKENDYWRGLDFTSEYHGIKRIEQKKHINEARIVKKIEELLDRVNLNKSSGNKVYFEIIGGTEGLFYITTTQPEVQRDKLFTLIKSLQDQVWIDLKSEQIEIIENSILHLVDHNDERRFKLNLEKQSRVALLKESKKISLELGINYPNINYPHNAKEIYTLGSKYISAEISALKKRKNDELFIFLPDKTAADINTELKYFLSLDADSLTNSEKNSRNRNILRLEREKAYYTMLSKELKLARIAMLEESLIMANALGINDPLINDNHLPKVTFTNEYSFGEDLSEIHEVIYFPSDKPLLENAPLMGTKYLTALINNLESRENDDYFDPAILRAKLQIDFYERYLNNFNKINPKPFEINKTYKLQKKENYEKQELFFRTLTFGSIVAFLLTFLVIMFKHDLRRIDNN